MQGLQVISYQVQKQQYIDYFKWDTCIGTRCKKADKKKTKQNTIKTCKVQKQQKTKEKSYFSDTAPLIAATYRSRGT